MLHARPDSSADVLHEDENEFFRGMTSARGCKRKPLRRPSDRAAKKLRLGDLTSEAWTESLHTEHERLREELSLDAQRVRDELRAELSGESQQLEGRLEGVLRELRQRLIANINQSTQKVQADAQQNREKLHGDVVDMVQTVIQSSKLEMNAKIQELEWHIDKVSDMHAPKVLMFMFQDHVTQVSRMESTLSTTLKTIQSDLL